MTEVVIASAADALGAKGTIVRVEQDEHSQADNSMEKPARLRPVFKEEGTITVGNASGPSLDDIDLIEVNEAFAARVLAVEKEMDWDVERRNVHGGAVALGHPTGCSGARIVVTLVHAMRQRDAEVGLATLCVSGGLGMSILLQRE